MKKIVILIIMLITVSLSGLLALDKEQTDSWIDLVGEKDLQVKMQKLEAYFNKYGGKEDRNSMYMYLQLAFTTYQLQQYEKTIQFGEKALTYKEIENSHKLQLNLYLANAYNLTKKTWTRPTSTPNRSLCWAIRCALITRATPPSTSTTPPRPCASRCNCFLPKLRTRKQPCHGFQQGARGIPARQIRKVGHFC